jgi:hypothetical protein
MEPTRLILSSRNRANGSESSTNFTVQLPGPLQAKYAQLEGWTVSAGDWTVNPGRDYLTFEEQSPNVEYTINLTNGFKSATEIAADIQTKMNAVSSGYTVTYYPSTYKIVITGGANFRLKNLSSSTSIGYNLGFQYMSTGVTSYATTQTGNAIVQLYPHFYGVRIEGSDMTCMESSGNAKYYTFVMPTNGASGEVVSSTNLTFPPRFKIPYNTQSLSVRIYDSDGGLTSRFNGGDVTFYLILLDEKGAPFNPV